VIKHSKNRLLDLKEDQAESKLSKIDLLRNIAIDKTTESSGGSESDERERLSSLE